jgi:hypothetical protein
MIYLQVILEMMKMTTNNHILYNLFKSGLINDGGDEVAQFVTIDNQYRFELTRKNYELWFTDTSYKYKCIIDIYNNLTGTLIVSLNCTEEDIMNMLDVYTQMCDFGSPSVYIPPLKPYNSNGNYYIIELELFRVNNVMGIMEDISNRWFTVKEYSPLIQTLVPIVSIKMDVSEIEDLMDLVYFIFLIDLESENQLMPITDMAPSEYSRYVKDNVNHV